MDWFGRLITELTSGVSVSHPGILLVVFLLGGLSELGFPLFFSIETFLFFASYDHGPLSSPVLLLVAMLLAGRLVGSLILYFITRLIGSSFINWLGKRMNWFYKAVEAFKKRVDVKPITAVTLGRLTPGLLQVPSLTAGLIKLNPLKFAAGVAFSSIIYDVILILLGFSATFALPHLKAGAKTYLFIGFFLLIAIVWAILFISFRRVFTKRVK